MFSVGEERSHLTAVSIDSIYVSYLYDVCMTQTNQTPIFYTTTLLQLATDDSERQYQARLRGTSIQIIDPTELP
jgi:hypothetical protein